MKIGLFFRVGNPEPWQRDWHQLYGEMLEQCEAGEALGFDAVTTTEHHFSPDGYVPCPLTVEAAIAARTERVLICSYVLLLPLYHPLRLAEEAALVDVISGGRLVLGMGLGFRWEEYAAFGVDRKRSGPRMDECIEVLVRAFTEDRFTFKGEFFDIVNSGMTPKSYRKPRPLMWLGRPDNEASIRRIAQWELDGFAGEPPPHMYDKYLKLCAEYGTAPHAKGQRLLFGHCAQDPERAWHEAKKHAQWSWAWYRDWHWSYGNTTVMNDPLRDDAEQFVFADPDGWKKILGEIASHRDPEVSHTFVGLALPGLPHETVMNSMELFAREVLPAVQEA